MKPITYPRVFDSWYECSRTAHIESVKVLTKMGYAYVNKYQVGTKYSCLMEKTIRQYGRIVLANNYHIL